jgi:hypothetical protein
VSNRRTGARYVLHGSGLQQQLVTHVLACVCVVCGKGVLHGHHRLPFTLRHQEEDGPPVQARRATQRSGTARPAPPTLPLCLPTRPHTHAPPPHTRAHTHYQRISSILYRVGRSLQRAGRLLLLSLPQSHRHHHFDVIVHSTTRNCLTPNHDTLIPSLCVFLAASLTSHACRQRYRWCRLTSTRPASNSSSRAGWSE